METCPEKPMPPLLLFKSSGPSPPVHATEPSHFGVYFEPDEFISSGILPAGLDADDICNRDERLALPSNSLRDSEGQDVTESFSTLPEDQNNCSSIQQNMELSQPLPGTGALLPATAPLQSPRSGHNDRKQANREHQKRFRAKQKVHKARAQSLELELERTVQELKGLQVRQQMLETELSQAQRQNATKTDGQVDKAKQTWLDGEVIEKPPLQVTLPGHECQLTVADMGSMTPLRFKSFWAAYMNALQNCLSSMQHSHDSTQQDKMVQLVWETMRLKCLHIFGAGPGLMPRPDILNNQADYLIGIFGLSNGQVQDLMFLREVYVLKEHELNMQQATLTAFVHNKSPDPLLDLTKVASIGTELRVNAAQCHQLVQRLCWAMYFGVMTMKQSAQLLMHSDPDLILAEVLLHHIAAQQGLPSKPEMLNARKRLTTQNWSRFWQYTEAVNPYVSLRHEYIPVPDSMTTPMPMTSQTAFSSGMSLY